LGAGRTYKGVILHLYTLKDALKFPNSESDTNINLARPDWRFELKAEGSKLKVRIKVISLSPFGFT